MSSNLTLTSSLGNPTIPVGSQARLVYVLVEIGGGQGAGNLPLNLSLVLDSSNSMRIRLLTEEQFAQLAAQGQAVEIVTDGVPAWEITDVLPQVMSQFPRRIEYVRDALHILSNQLRPTDYFAVTAFANEAVTLIPATTGVERHKLHTAARQLENLDLGNDTQMTKGLDLGLRELQRNASAKTANRLIVLTDGFTQNIDDCFALTKLARERGVVVSTLGIGSEFNEDLLIPLADLTGGNAYYIETPDQILEAFQNEMGTALAITCHNLELKLQLSQNVELRRAHRVLPMIGTLDPGPNQGGSYSVFLGDYIPTAAPSLLLEFLLPPWQAGHYRIAQTLLAWDDPTGGLARSNIRGDIVVEVSEQNSMPVNGRVMNIVEKVSAFRLGTRALTEAQTGDPGKATINLRRVATRLLDMGETALAETLRMQATALEQKGQLDQHDTKKLRYETRKITQRLD
jgi:Ca-activated chloride channel family protein